MSLCNKCKKTVEYKANYKFKDFHKNGGLCKECATSEKTEDKEWKEIVESNLPKEDLGLFYQIVYNDATKQHVIISKTTGKIIGSCEDYEKEQENSKYPVKKIKEEK